MNSFTVWNFKRIGNCPRGSRKWSFVRPVCTTAVVTLEFSFGGWHVCQSSALVSPSFFEVVPACPTDIPAAFFTKTSVISLKAQLWWCLKWFYFSNHFSKPHSKTSWSQRGHWTVNRVSGMLYWIQLTYRKSIGNKNPVSVGVWEG